MNTETLTQQIFSQAEALNNAVRAAYNQGRKSAIAEAKPFLRQCPKCGDCDKECDNCDYCNTSPETGI